MMRIGCGCVNLGAATSTGSWRDHVRLVRDAVDAGVSLFDTADAYSSGISERVLGAALDGRRHEVAIATKVGYVFRPRSRVEQEMRRVAARVRPFVAGVRGGASEPQTAGSVAPDSRSSGYQAQDFSRVGVERALRSSLDRLGVDYIDVYQLHGPPRVLDEALGALVDARTAGLVREIGVGAESIESAVEWIGVPEIDVIQLPFGVLDPEAASAVLDVGRGATDPADFWVRGVLGGGVLAAAMRDPDALSDHPKGRLVLGLLDIARRSGMQLDELAVRWVSGYEGIDSMLVGMSSVDHLRRIVELSTGPPLTDDVVAAVSALHAGGQDSPGGPLDESPPR